MRTHTHTHTHTPQDITQPKQKNCILPFAKTFMDIENIMLSEIDKDKYSTLLLVSEI